MTGFWTEFFSIFFAVLVADIAAILGLYLYGVRRRGHPVGDAVGHMVVWVPAVMFNGIRLFCAIFFYVLMILLIGQIAWDIYTNGFSGFRLPSLP